MIIGFCGSAGSGKDTAASILLENGFEKYSWAQPLKDAVSLMFGWDREMIEGLSDESRLWREKPDEWWSSRFEKEITPRWVLQYFGTEVMRGMFHENFWCYCFERKYDANKNYVITDVRFGNEFDTIQKLNGKVLQIQRGELPDFWDDAIHANQTNNKAIMKDKWPDIHESEWGWIGQPVADVIHNDSTIESLRKKVKEVVFS